MGRPLFDLERVKHGNMKPKIHREFCGDWHDQHCNEDAEALNRGGPDNDRDMQNHDARIGPLCELPGTGPEIISKP
jgi:hypothetical protein